MPTEDAGALRCLLLWAVMCTLCGLVAIAFMPAAASTDGACPEPRRALHVLFGEIALLGVFATVTPLAPDGPLHTCLVAGMLLLSVLPIPIARREVLPLAAGEAIRVRPDALGFVPRMLYYTDAHPVVAAWIATHATPELLAAQVVPLEFANTTAVVAIGVPSGTLAARFYIDCWPRQETPGLIQLLEVSTADYERDAQPLSGATAGLFEDRICKGALPPPELYIFRVSPLQSTSVHVSPAQPGWT